MNDKQTFSPAWMVAMFVLFLCVVGVGVFVLSSNLDNSKRATERVCVERNQQLEQINNRFLKLTDLLDAAIAHAEDPASPEVLELFGELKVPIRPPIACEQLRP